MGPPLWLLRPEFLKVVVKRRSLTHNGQNLPSLSPDNRKCPWVGRDGQGFTRDSDSSGPFGHMSKSTTPKLSFVVIGGRVFGPP